MEENKNVANRIWYFRKRMRLGQKQVAYLMGLRSAAHISHYERGLKHPRLENLLKLEVVLRVPISFLYQDLMTKARKEIRQREKRFPGHLASLSDTRH